MTITAIKAQVKHPQRVSVYADGAYQFSLSHAQLLEQKLRVGLQIDASRLAALKKASDFGKAYERAFNYALIRPRSIKEIQDYCRRKQWTADDCQAILQKLIAKRYVDDRVFAKAWAQSRQLTKAISSRRLMLELKQKGITDDVITEVLKEVGFNDDTSLGQLIAKKRRLSRYANDPQKLMQYLVRQGFSYQKVKDALERDVT